MCVRLLYERMWVSYTSTSIFKLVKIVELVQYSADDDNFIIETCVQFSEVCDVTFQCLVLSVLSIFIKENFKTNSDIYKNMNTQSRNKEHYSLA